jgi:LDH2 family malate/lactate/ureidoglycolate dehydrogenase
MIIKKVHKLRKLVKEIITKLGADENIAVILADSLVSASLRMDTHGIGHLPYYADQIRKGELDLNASPEIIMETKNNALVKGNWTFGQVTAKFAMEIAIDKAKKK